MTQSTESRPDRPVQPVQPDRSFGWWDMFARPEDDPRGDGGFTGERDTLVGCLRDQRLTLETTAPTTGRTWTSTAQ